MDLYKILCSDCKQKADEWSSTDIKDRSEENWKENYQPCDSCYAKVRAEITAADTQNPKQ